MTSKLFVLVGFGVGTVAGFVYGQTMNKNAPGHVKTDYSNGVVTISADVKNLAKTSFKEARDSATDKLRAYFGL